MRYIVITVLSNFTSLLKIYISIPYNAIIPPSPVWVTYGTMNLYIFTVQLCCAYQHHKCTMTHSYLS